MENPKVFANGLIFKKPGQKAPSWIIGNVSVKVDEFINFLNEHNYGSEWVNLEIKESKTGKVYCELSTFDPKATKPRAKPWVQEEENNQEALNNMGKGVEYPDEEISPDDIPF